MTTSFISIKINNINGIISMEVIKCLKLIKNHPNGVISSVEAEMMIGNAEVFIRNCADSEKNLNIVFTKDTHYLESDGIPSEMWYKNSLEGRKLPIVHCIKGTDG